MLGIDISEYQDSVNWDVVKNSVDYVILRDGYGYSTTDKMFSSHVNGAKKAAIPIVGIYHFSYSLTPEDARIEAEFAMKKFDEAGLDKNNAVIFFDFEDDSIRYAKQNSVTIGASECIAITKAFCDTLKSKGYRYGVYFNNNFYNNYYNKGKGIPEGAITWYADYRSNPTKSIIKATDLFQYSSTGKIDGIKGNVDVNDGDYTKFYSKSEVKEEITQAEIEALAKEVMAGKYGNGDERKQKLGKYYDAVQKRVNELVAAQKTVKPVTDQVVADVIAGKYGNGEDRKKRLEAAGYIYRNVQDAVNKALKSTKSTSPAKSFDNNKTGKYAVTATALNVRYIPGLMTDNNVFKILNSGDTVQCWGYYTTIGSTTWLLIQIGNNTGYVDERYVKRV